MSDPSAEQPPSSVFLATSAPADLAAAADTAIAAARAGIAALIAGEARDDVDALDIFDEAQAVLSNASSIAHLVAEAHPDEAMRTVGEATGQEIAKVSTEISLNPDVYRVLADLDVSGEDETTRYYLSQTLRDFRRSGVDRDPETRELVRALREDLKLIGQAFGRNIRTDRRVGALPPSALAGMPDDYVRQHQPGEDGLVRITTEYPDIVPFLSYATDGEARRQMWTLFRSRAYPDNVDVFRQLLTRRYELATILGYDSYAQYITEDKMIGTDKAAAEFIARITELSRERAAREYDELLERKRVDEPDATEVFPWDSSYLQDRLKSEKLAFDTQAVRPYFEYTRVKAGVMALVERMFEVTFTRREDLPAWHAEVEAYDVTSTPTGELIGRIFLDMHPRPNKFGHAAQFDMVTGKRGATPATTRIPEGALMCNFPRPGKSADDVPGLMQHSEVTTFFHEFGHLIHAVISGHQRWSGISGISTEWDFVEAPSQLLEEWTLDAATLATFAVHHETGEPLPAHLVATLRAADDFGKGMFVRQQMFYAALSLTLYASDPAGIDSIQVERDLTVLHTPYRHIDGTYLHLSFGHLDGYSAIYYTYMWSLVIAKDLFTRFAAEGLPAPVTSKAYREAVLAPGGSKPAAQLVHDFLGRDYTFSAYQQWLDAD